jgi:RNA polymerase sigma factor (sigma-70 family)
MNGRVSAEYIELKKNIALYIDKYPTANRVWNREKLLEMAKLKPNLSDPKVAKKYYRIRDTIVLANGGFAMKYVTRYYSIMNDEASIAELFQEATIGLIETIDAFNPAKKTSFTTYAFYHIRKRIIDFIKKNKLVKAPRDIARNMKHVDEAQGHLLSTTGKEPNAKEIAKYLSKEKKIKLKEVTVDKIMVLLELNSSGSEDAFISEYKDQISYDDDSELFRDMELNILTSISGLDDVNKKAVHLRFGIGRDYPHSPEETKLILDLQEDDDLTLE